jgi:hypothetical protein
MKVDLVKKRTLKYRSTTAILMILVLTVSAFATFAPTVSAKEINTYTYVTAAPNPGGVSQTMYIIFWLNFPPPTAEGLYGDRWQGFQLNITRPDGQVETKGPFTSDIVGTVFTPYTPTQTGTYKLQVSFPGQTLAGANLRPGSTQGREFIGDFFKPAVSPVVEVTVQQNPIELPPPTPLPTGYWTRPIYGENHEWYTIGSNWLMNGYDYNGRFFDVGSAYNPYSDAPGAPHVLWKLPIDDGGIVGGAGAIDGSAMQVGYYNGMSYEAKFTPPLVINGRLYYNIYPASAQQVGGALLKPGFAVVDLYTGKELWRKTDAILSMAQIYDYESFNQHGAQSYLWSFVGSKFFMFDAVTGDLLVTIENATGGGMPVLSSKGDLLLYYLSGAANTLLLWNSSKCIPPLNPALGSEAFQWRPEQKRLLDWKGGIEWNVTVPDVDGVQSIRTATKTWDTDVLVAASLVLATNTTLAYVVEVGYDAKTGAQLWVENRGARQDNPLPIWILLDYGNVADGIYTYRVRDQLITYAYDAKTGAQKWVSEPTEDAWSMFPSAGWNVYGKHYFASYDGKVHAYNLQTGAKLWEYFGGSSGLETPYGVRPFYSGILFADGKIFASNSEHSPNQPLFKGHRLHVIDAETGKGIWNLSGWFTSHQNMIVDGYFIGHNGYDNQIYTIGKGPSATTVTASPKVIARGTSVLIEGTVTDQSPASKDTPAIADADMGPWMEYIHMQQPLPTHVNGVNVKLTAHLADGSTANIGTVTSDAYGKFGTLWTPPSDGTFRIVAEFEGSASYGSSADETFVGVGTAPSGSPIVTPTPPTSVSPSTTSVVPPGDGLSVGTYLVVAAVIIIIAVIAAAVVLRRRTK